MRTTLPREKGSDIFPELFQKKQTFQGDGEKKKSSPYQAVAAELGKEKDLRLLPEKKDGKGGKRGESGIFDKYGAGKTPPKASGRGGGIHVKSLKEFNKKKKKVGFLGSEQERGKNKTAGDYFLDQRRKKLLGLGEK